MSCEIKLAGSCVDIVGVAFLVILPVVAGLYIYLYLTRDKDI